MSETNTNLTRANRIAVAIANGEFVAQFWRTHKQVGTLAQHSLPNWAPSTENKNLAREEFRLAAIAAAPEMGLYYQPEDQRTADNQRKASYLTQEDLAEDASAMVWPDITQMLADTGHADMRLTAIAIDEVLPLTKTPNGRDLADLGITDGKYTKSGKWAWATLRMCATIQAPSGDEIYAAFPMDLASGQLRKPTMLDGVSWNKTNWAALLTKELEALKAEDAATETTTPPAPTETTEAPKGKGKSRQAKDEAAVH